MISLFLDTSSKKLNVILVKDNKIIFEKNIETKNDHAEFTVPFIEEGLKNNNLETKDIDKIFVVNGPGSFTGTRIGVTVSKTICYANDINVIPVSSLKQFIFLNDKYDYYVSMIIDKNDKLYYGIYDKDYNDIVMDKYSTTTDLNNDVSKLQGSIVFISDKSIDGYNTINQELNIIKLIDYYKDKGINSFSLKPNYLKKIEVEEKL